MISQMRTIISKIKQTKINIVIFSFFLLTTVIISSCKNPTIGLGKSVDTEAPKVSITQPTNGRSSICGKFKVKGTCSDDGDIKSISVTLTYLDKRDEKGEKVKVDVFTDKNATITPLNTTGKIKKMDWEYEINPFDEKNGSLLYVNENGEMIPVYRDGSYQITVTAMDTYEHKTTDNVTIKIDNMPPILVLQRPSTIMDSKSPDSYGQEFSIAGQSADDSDIERVEVHIFNPQEDVTCNHYFNSVSDHCEHYWNSVVLKKIPPTVDMAVTRWVPDKEESGEAEDLYKIATTYVNGGYRDLYGDSKEAGTKNFYCTISVYDDAHPCPDKDANGNLLDGNRADYYYLYNDIYREVISGYNLKVTQIYSILNYTSDLLSVSERDKVRTLMNGESEGSKRNTKGGSFSLNPLNNPTFAVSGYDSLKDGEDNRVLNNRSIIDFMDQNNRNIAVINGNKVTINVSPGRDNIPLIDDTIGIQVIPVDMTVNYSEIRELLKDDEASAITLLKPILLTEKDDNLEYKKSDITADEIDARAMQIESHGSDRSVVVELSKADGLEIGKTYIFKILGCDEKDNKYENNGIVYGFVFRSNGSAPLLDVDLPSDDLNYLNETSEVTVQGVTTHEEGKPSISICITGESKEPIEIHHLTKCNEDGSFAYNLTEDDFKLFKEGSNTITIISEYGDKSTRVTRTVIFDKTAPTVNANYQVKPLISSYTSGNETHEQCVNGVVTFSGTMFDKNGIVSANYVVKTGEKEVAKGTLRTDSTDFEFTADTTLGDDKTDLNAILTLVDVAGNKTDFEFLTKDDEPKPYFIWQESDRPIFTSTNFTVGLEDSGIERNTNLFGTTTNNRISGELSDDDGIKQVEVKVRKLGDETAWNEIEGRKVLENKSLKTTSFEYLLADDDGKSFEEGKYEILVIATDTEGETTGEKSISSWIGISSGNPRVVISYENGEFRSGDYVQPGKQITVSGYIECAPNIRSSLKRTYKDESQNIPVDSEGKWTDTFTTESETGEHEIVYTVANIFKQEGTTSLKYGIDKTPPIVKSISLPTNADTLGSSFTFIGETDDPSPGTGVASVALSIEDEDGNSVSPAVNGTANWSSKVTFRNYADTVFKNEGEKKITVTVKDYAENEATETKTFIYDKAVPTVTLGYTPTGYMPKEGLTLTGTFADSYKLASGTGEAAAFEIEQRFYADVNEEPDTTCVYLSVEDGTKSGTFAQEIPFKQNEDGTISADTVVTGNYVYTITVKDSVGNETTTGFDLVADLAPPNVAITNPLDGTAKKQNAIHVENARFEGTAADVGASGVAKVYYKITSTRLVPDSEGKVKEAERLSDANSNGWTSTVTTASWNFSQKFVSGDTAASALKADELREGTYFLNVYAVDKAENVSSLITCEFDVDLANPTVKTKIITETKNGAETTVEEAEIKDTALVSKTEKNYTFYFYVTDTLNPDSTTYKIDLKKNGESLAETKDYTVSAKGADGYYSVTIENFDSDDADGLYCYTVTAIDSMEKSTTVERNIRLDTKPPVLEPTSPEFTDAKVVKDWQSSKKISLKGIAIDDTGVKGVYFNPDPNGVPKLPKIDISLAADAWAASWSELNWIYAGTSSWTANLDTDTTTLSDGDHTVYIVAVDVNGKCTAVEDSKYTVKVDRTLPKLELKSIDNENAEKGKSKLVNGKSDVKFTVQVSDTPGSGVVNVRYASVSYTEPTPIASKNYSFTIEKEKLVSGGVSVEVTDSAGNKASDTVFNIILDNTPPEITLNAPTDADSSKDGVQVNKKITLSGTAKDDNTLKTKPVFYYTSTNPVPNEGDKVTEANFASKGFTKLTDVSTGTLYSWTSAEIDTTKFSGDGIYYFVAEMVDEAGNKGYSNVLVLDVDQNSDRPVITITGLHPTENTLYKNQTLYGSIFDDDGEVKNLWYYVGATAPSAAPTQTLPGAWSPVQVTNNSWNFKMNSDGAKKLWFYCIDSVGCGFSQGATTALSRPYFTFADYEYSGTRPTDTKIEKANGTEFQVDTVAPVITEIDIAQENTTSSYTNATYNGWGNDGTSANPNKKSVNTFFGGGKGKLFLKVTVREATMMADANEKPVLIKTTLGDDEIEIPCDSRLLKQTGVEYTYLLGPIDVTTSFDGINLENGNVKTGCKFENKTTTLTVVAKDKAGTNGELPTSIIIDMEHPTVSISSPIGDVSSAITVRGRFEDGVGVGVQDLYYIIPTKEQQSDISKITSWKEITDASASWSISMLGNTPGIDNDLEDPTYLGYYANDTYAVKDSTLNKWTIPFYFKTIDKLGNEGIVKTDADNTPLALVFDRDAGMPEAAIIYPDNNAKVGGRINISGSASDDKMVTEVRIQIDVNGDGKFDDADYNFIKDCNDGKEINGKQKAPFILGDNPNDKLFAGNSSEDWYIKAEGTNSWKVNIDTRQLEEDIKQIYVRVKALDVEGILHSREWVGNGENKLDKYKYDIDQNVPRISDLKLIRKNSGGTVDIERTYTSGMFITNTDKTAKWYFSFKLSDNMCVNGYQIDKKGDGDIIFEQMSENDEEFKSKKAIIDNDNTKEEWEGTFELELPLANNNDGKITSTITVFDDLNQTTSESILINVDSTAPKMNYKDATNKSTLKLVSSSGKEINLINPIQDSDKLFALRDIDGLEESGSGLAYIAFYFKRQAEDGSNTRVYDPMRAHGERTDGKYANQTNISAQSETSGTTYINSDGLPVMYINGTRSDETTITSEALKNNENVRVGHLIKIGGSYRLVKTFDNTSGTLIFDSTVSTEYKTAEVVYAQVVDHLITEGPVTWGSGDSYILGIDGNDDGDGMLETIRDESPIYKWSATIQSSFIPDGPIELHVVSIDKSGNLEHGWLETSIQNSPPRISKLFIGTDLSGNDAFEIDEFEEYNILAKYFGESQLSVDLTTRGYSKYEQNSYGDWIAIQADPRKSFKIKNKLAIAPEFVGGTGDIKVIFNNNNVDGEGFDKLDNGRSLISSETTGIPAGASKMYVFNNTNFPAEIQGTNRRMSFTFWDETEELVQGKTSQCAYLRVFDFEVNTKDVIRPNVVIHKFFWTDSSTNSLYKNSKENGHIELEGDLPDELKNNDGGYKKGNPKVSGKIVVRGTVFDETSLSKVKVNFGSLNDVTAATYGEVDGVVKWIPAATTLEADGWEFKVYDHNSMTAKLARSHFGIPENVKEEAAIKSLAYFGQDGHKIAWELTIDTEKILGDKIDTSTTPPTTSKIIAAIGQELEIVAVDNAKDDNGVDSPNSSDNSDGKTGAGILPREPDETPDDGKMHRPTYAMDIVPYITKVWTPMAKEDKSNWSVYNRTALGHYPISVVKAGGNATPSVDKIYLYGFNLENGTLSDEDNKTAALLLGINSNDGGKQAYSVQLPADDIKGGKITVTVNGVQSINNSNNNNANGFKEFGTTQNISDVENASYGDLSTYCYNRQPNNSNNDRLTDDVVIDIWDLNTQAATTVFRGYIEQPVMSINPVNKNVGFAYHNGSMNFSMGGTHKGTQYSTKYWIGGTDGWTSIGFAYDKLGFSYGAASSGDIDGATGGIDRYRFFTDRWGVGQYSTKGYTGKYNSNRIELIAQLETDGDVIHSRMERERIQSSSIATTVNGSSSNVYLAYYDLLNNEIRFKCGTFTDNHTGEDTGDDNVNEMYSGGGGSKKNYATNVGLFVDEYGPASEIYPNLKGYGSTVSGYEYNGSIFSTKDRTVKGAEYYRLNHINLIAGMQTEAPVNMNTTADYSTGYDAGEYVSIAAIPPGTGNATDNDVVVAVWWDATNKRLMYSYIEDPMKMKTVERLGVERIEKDDGNTLDPYIEQIATRGSSEVYFYYGQDVPENRITITKGADGYYYSTDANGDTRHLFAYGDHPGSYTYAKNTGNTLYYLNASGDGKNEYFPEVKLDYDRPSNVGDKDSPGTHEAGGNAKNGSILYKDDNSWDALKVSVANTTPGTPFYGINLDSDGKEDGAKFSLYIKNGDSYEEAVVTDGAVKNLLYYQKPDGTYKRLWRAQIKGSDIKYKGKDYDNSKFMTPIYARVYKDVDIYTYEGGYRYTETNMVQTETIDGDIKRIKPVHKANGWTEPQVLATGGIGEYCKVVVDGKGGIHVAAYDNNETSVVYFYSPSYTSSFEKYVVDSQGQVGEEIGLDVAIDSNGKAVPYITYYSKTCSRPKIAYLVDEGDGADNGDKYTGKWEIAVIPTTSNVPRENNHNNVALWKDDSGNQIDSLIKDESGNYIVGTSENHTDAKKRNISCIIYGNGTKNAILGYATKTNGQGYIETAQMRSPPDTNNNGGGGGS